MTSPPFRVETVPVRRTGRGPIVIAALMVTLVAVSIVKPWAGADPSPPDQAPDVPSPAAAAANAAANAAAAAAVKAAANAPGGVSSSPGPRETAHVIADAAPAPLTVGQVECGSSDWRIVTLGDFGRWTVRTWIAITPVEAVGPGDAAIPDLSLGESDVAGLGACAPATSSGALGRASRIMQAWRQSPDGATTTTATAAVFGRVTLAQLDPLPSGGPVAARSPTSKSVTELFRPVPASRGGRWPAGRYVLLLASPDVGPDRWIAVDIGGAGR